MNKAVLKIVFAELKIITTNEKYKINVPIKNQPKVKPLPEKSKSIPGIKNNREPIIKNNVCTKPKP